MSIPLDQFFSVAPETNFKACGYANLGGTDSIFYVSSTNELRVQPFGNTTSTVLVLDVIWADVIGIGGVAQVYYIDLNGRVFNFQYDNLGPIRRPIVQILGLPTAVTISTIFNPHSTPNIYCLMLDDGGIHWLFTAATANFATILNSIAVYSNAIDPLHFASKPTIKVHPSDTNRATVIIQRLLVSGNLNEIGFYVLTIPGVA